MTVLRRKERVYYTAVLLSALICWSPFNALAYAAPFIVLAFLTLLGGDAHLLKRTAVWILFWTGAVAFYGLVNQEFQFGNAFVAFVTWAGVVIILLIPSRGIGSQELRQKVERIAWMLLAVESVWGIMQGLYGYTRTGTFDLATGDYVEGTIHPWLEAELAYSNVMFAINIALLLLFLLPAVWRRPTTKRVAIYSLGMLAFVMASVVHAILFLIVAGGVSALLVYGKRLRLSRMIGFATIFGAIVLLTWVFLPRNLGTVRAFALQILRGEVPKSVSVITALTEMPHEYWYLPVIGLGPGQYASRAGLISTGLYFGGLQTPKEVPFLPNQLTESQAKYLLPLWEWHASVQYFGSTQKPYFSWLAVYTEWGLLGWLVVVVMVVVLLRNVRNLLLTYDKEKFVLIAAIVFIFLLGFQENNWEVPQAWFSGLLFLKVLYANGVWWDKFVRTS